MTTFNDMVIKQKFKSIRKSDIQEIRNKLRDINEAVIECHTMTSDNDVSDILIEIMQKIDEADEILMTRQYM